MVQEAAVQSGQALQLTPWVLEARGTWKIGGPLTYSHFVMAVVLTSTAIPCSLLPLLQPVPSTLWKGSQVTQESTDATTKLRRWACMPSRLAEMQKWYECMCLFVFKSQWGGSVRSGPSAIQNYLGLRTNISKALNITCACQARLNLFNIMLFFPSLHSCKWEFPLDLLQNMLTVSSFLIA